MKAQLELNRVHKRLADQGFNQVSANTHTHTHTHTHRLSQYALQYILHTYMYMHMYSTFYTLDICRPGDRGDSSCDTALSLNT